MSFIINPYAHDTNDLIGPNTALNLSFNNTKAMLQEAGVAVTDAATNGDAVGLVYDQTINGLILRQDVSANRPILGSDGTRNNYLTFDGTNDNLPILSSLSFFNTFHAAVPKGTFLIWFKMNGGDGVSQFLISNTDYTTAANDVGLQIFRDNSNKITARSAVDQSGAGFIWTYQSTATITVASGWRGLIVSVNGTGASAGRFILMDSSGTILENNTFAVTAGSTVNAQLITYIGARADPTTPDLFLNGDLSCIIVENFPVSDKLIDQFKQHNPIRTSQDFVILQWLMDMNNNVYIFNDAALTVPASNGEAVRGLRNSVIGNFNVGPTFGALRRQLTSTSSGTSAIYRTNQINGNATLEFDGVDDNYDFLNEFFEERGGKNTLFIVAKNDDATNGSHWFSGNFYSTLTGSSYGVGNNPRWVIHLDPNVGPIGQDGENQGVDGYKIIAYRRDGASLAGWNALKVKATSTSSSRLSFTDMGLAWTTFAPDWNADGHLAYVAKYNGVMSDAEVEAEIDRLKARFGL